MTRRHGLIENAHQFSRQQLGVLRQRAANLQMDFDVYYRRGQTGYFDIEEDFNKEEKKKDSRGFSGFDGSFKKKNRALFA